MSKKSIHTAVSKTLADLPWLESELDAGVARLALTYAQVMDDALAAYAEESISYMDLMRGMKVGVELMAALRELGATPLARKTIQAVQEEKVDDVDELKARRAARAAGK